MFVPSPASGGGGREGGGGGGGLDGSSGSVIDVGTRDLGGGRGRLSIGISGILLWSAGSMGTTAPLASITSSPLLSLMISVPIRTFSTMVLVVVVLVGELGIVVVLLLAAIPFCLRHITSAEFMAPTTSSAFHLCVRKNADASPVLILSPSWVLIQTRAPSLLAISMPAGAPRRRFPPSHQGLLTESKQWRRAVSGNAASVTRWLVV